MRKPEKYHADEHRRGDFDSCWDCQRARAICRSKLRFASWEAADSSVRQLNEMREYVRPVVRYRCRWCLQWHMKTARNKVDLHRAEKQRRKWIRACREQVPSAGA